MTTQALFHCWYLTTDETHVQVSTDALLQWISADEQDFHFLFKLQSSWSTLEGSN